MSLLKIKQQVQTRLSTLFPGVSIAYENVAFDAPEGTYFRVTFNPRNPTDSVYGTKYYRENILFTVFVVSPGNKGTSEVLTKAEEIRTAFDRGTFMQVDNLRIHVFDKPQISGTGYLEGRVVVPVFINITAEVYLD